LLSIQEQFGKEVAHLGLEQARSVASIWESLMSAHFKGRVAIVTGGASGIGKALCEELHRRGAHVVVADIDISPAKELAASLNTAGRRASAAHTDVADPEQVHRLVVETAAEYGRIDFMFNNAAASATRGVIADLSLESWHRAIDVNFMGILHGTIEAYAVMAAQGYGHIVNTSSLAGLIGYPTSIPYGVSKAAVVNLSTSFRIEAESAGVRVSVVCPGPVHGEGSFPLKLIGVDRAAQLILNGVVRNEAIVVFPLSARVLWRLHRFSPRLLFPIGRKLVRDFRRRRDRVEALAMQT
jgi:NAD(P)-dependent dehydrogenase (short-subunit alcohol dehydrogenase family)